MGTTSTGAKVLADLEKEYSSDKAKTSGYSKGTLRPRRKPRKTGSARLTYRSKV